MNTNTMEMNLNEMELVNGGGLLDDIIKKGKEIATEIGKDAIQSFCNHHYIRTGVTRMRPFCCKDILQHELFCTKCLHKKWTED